MRVVGTEVLAEYCKSHADSKDALIVWLAFARGASWNNIADLRNTFPHAYFVRPFTLFNIKGNNYRLITLIEYKRQIVYVDKCLTHAEYDKEKWKS